MSDSVSPALCRSPSPSLPGAQTLEDGGRLTKFVTDVGPEGEYFFGCVTSSERSGKMGRGHTEAEALMGGAGRPRGCEWSCGEMGEKVRRRLGLCRAGRCGGRSVCGEGPVKPEWKGGSVRRPGRWSGKRWWRLGREGGQGLGVQAESRRLLGVKPCVGAAACLTTACSRLRFVSVSPPEAWNLQPIETIHFSQRRQGERAEISSASFHLARNVNSG